MNETIAIIVLAVLFILAVIRSIEWRDLAVKWVGNDPQKAQVYIKAGDTVHTVIGKRILNDAVNGDKYQYKEGKEVLEVILGNDYPYAYIRGRRIIGISDGQVVANPLGYMDADAIKNYRETQVSISTNTLMHLVMLIRSVKQSKPFSWTMLLIVGLIAIAGVYLYQNYYAKEAVPPANQPAQTQTIEQAIAESK